jgi:hypothetical protein
MESPRSRNAVTIVVNDDEITSMAGTDDVDDIRARREQDPASNLFLLRNMMGLQTYGPIIGS